MSDAWVGAVDTVQERPWTGGQLTGLVFVVVFALLAIIGNLVMFILRVTDNYRRRHVSALELLVLNLLVVNTLLNLLVYPFDVVAYIVLEYWPFSSTYCYVSTFFTSNLPVIGSWSVAMMALHQLFSAVTLAGRVKFSSTAGVRWFLTLLPLGLVLLLAFAVHVPIAYAIWTVKQDATTCSLSNPDTLHDSIWYIWIPLGIASIALLMTFGLIRVFALPWSDSTASTLQISWSRRASEDAFDSVSAASSPYIHVNDRLPLTPVTTETSTPSEPNSGLRRTNMLLTVALFLSLLVFMGPYGTVQLLFHHWDPDVSEVSIHDMERVSRNHLLAWEITFTIMSIKPLSDAVAVFLCAQITKRMTNWSPAGLSA